MPRQPGLQGSPEQPGHDGSPVTPRDLAFRAMIQHAPKLRAHACKLLLFLLELSVRRGSPVIRSGRRNVMRYCGFSRKGYDRARKDIAALIPVIPGLPGSPLTFDLRQLWDEQGAGLQGSPVTPQPGLHGSPLSPRIPPESISTTGPPREPAFVKPGLHGSPVPISTTGPPWEPAFSKPGLHGSPVTPETSGFETGPPGEPALEKPGLHGSPLAAKNERNLRHGSSDDLDLDRSIDPPSGARKTQIPETREPNAKEIQAARSWLRAIRYQDGHEVHASADACVYALKAAGSMERLNWALSKLSIRITSNPAWRPKGAKTLRAWLRKSIATELGKFDDAAEERRPAAPDPPAAIPATGERFDTSAMVADLVGGVKRIR